MKVLLNKYLVLLAVSCSFISCTDELSEEVKNGENLSEEQQEIAKYENKSIRLVSKSNEELSHFLHKAGSIDEACEIDAPALGFDSKNYDKTSSAFTTDCVLDVQEFDLYFNGAEVEINVDQFLCEYVEYKPYRIFQYQPGETTRQQVNVNCDEVCGLALPTICNKNYRHMDVSAINVLNSSLSPLADKIFALDPTALGFSTLFKEQVLDSEPLECKFDYSKREPIAGPNCDEGSLTTHKVKINSREVDASSCSDPTFTTSAACIGGGETWTVGTEFSCSDYTDSTTQPTISILDGEEEEFKCGGKAGNCLATASSIELPYDKTSFILPNTDTGAFTQEIKMNAPFEEDLFSNIGIANYSRICSSTTNTKTDSQFDTTLNNLIGHEVEDMPSRTAYQAHAIDEDGNGIPDFTIFADHLLKGRGYYSAPTKNVQPYYAFNCLDQARDVKAQIRLFIREWDRTFTNDNSYVARISDINQSTPLMDATGDQAAGEEWNDILDLDDLLKTAFTDNQCQGLDYGVCYEPMPLLVNEAACTGGGGQWYFETCGLYQTAYTDQKTCEFNGAEWRVGGHCSDTAYLGAPACLDNNETWFPSTQLFPEEHL
jgi:hypothetical protein